MKWFYILFAFSMVSCQAQSTSTTNQSKMDKSSSNTKVVKTEQEWKQILDPEGYRILRESGTEYPGTGKFNVFDGRHFMMYRKELSNISLINHMECIG